MPDRIRVQRKRNKGLAGTAQPEHRVNSRVGRLDLAPGVDHQHAFGERFDHHGVDLRLHLRGIAVVQCQRFLAYQAQCEFAGHQCDHEQAGTGQRGLEQGRRGIAGPEHPAQAGIRQQQQRRHGGGAQSDQHRAEHGAHQHRQGEQWREVDAALLQRLQQEEGSQIDADGRQPADPEVAYLRPR